MANKKNFYYIFRGDARFLKILKETLVTDPLHLLEVDDKSSLGKLIKKEAKEKFSKFVNEVNQE